MTVKKYLVLNLDICKIRVYAFLAERFLPYWFNKYVKTLEWPIIFNDLKSEVNK